MTSRERVLAAIHHREPDRVPVDFSGHRSSGIMAIAYAKLKRHLGITTGDIYVYDMLQQLAIVEPPVLDRLGIDVIEMGRGFALRPEDWQPWILPDGTPCKIPAHIHPVQKNGDWYLPAADGTEIAVQPKGSLYFDQTCFPLVESNDGKFADLPRHLGKIMWCTVGSPPAPIGLDSAGLPKLKTGAEALRKSTDRAIVGLFGGNLLEIGQWLFRADNFFLELAGNPQRMHRLLDKLVELHLANLDNFLAAVGPSIDIIVFGDDLGTQGGPQISPAMYDEFFKPRHALMWQRAKKLQPHLKTMLHSCGGIHSLLPSLIAAGIDMINPVQTTCKDMEPERLKREFGRDLVFWGGGCDTRQVLPRGTPAAVAADVRERVRVLRDGGGFVFQQIHNIMADVPPANVVAMFDAIT